MVRKAARGAFVRGSWQSLSVQLVVSLVLSLIFSALPLLFAIFMDKSSLPLAVVMAWYSLFPPLIIFLGALWYNSGEKKWLRAIGLVWINVSVWFILQYVLYTVRDSNLLLLVLSLPTIFAGKALLFLVAGLVFLIVGVVLYNAGRVVVSPKPRAKLSWGMLAGLVIIALVIMPVLMSTFANPNIKPPVAVTVPSREEIFGFISDVYNLGERRPGSEADHRAIAYLEARLREFGYKDVHVEESSFDYWEAESWGITVQPGTEQAWQPEAFYVPYSGPTPPGGVTAEAIYLGDISQPLWQDVTGKIVLVDIPATFVAWDQMKLFSYMAYEPENTMKGISSPYPIGWMLKYVHFYSEVEARQPAGIVGILYDYPDMGRFTYYAPYDGLLRSIPSLYVKSSDGEKIKSLLKQGKVLIKLLLEAKVVPNGGRSANVYAVLPGQSPKMIMIHSHHDSPWRSGVEDSSGVGMVLALAKYYSRVPLTERPYTMVFMFTGSHMVGGPTNRDFVKKHQEDMLSKVVFDIAIEHIADDYMPPPYPKTDGVQPRGVFLTENPVIISLYATLVAKSQATRTLLFPTATPLGVPTDAFYFYQAGVPIISYISGPPWLFDEADTLERVADEELEPLARMYIDLISGINATPEPLLRFNLTCWVMGLLMFLSLLASLFMAYRSYEEH